MRPTRQATDLEYWLQSKAHWSGLAEEYFLATAARGITKEDEAFFEERRSNALEMAWRAEMKHQEAQGILVVYTGRAKPEWS